nr:uncharacterized protein LOC109174561 [Ipomoea batatas]
MPRCDPVLLAIALKLNLTPREERLRAKGKEFRVYESLKKGEDGGGNGMNPYPHGDLSGKDEGLKGIAV